MFSVEVVPSNFGFGFRFGLSNQSSAAIGVSSNRDSLCDLLLDSLCDSLCDSPSKGVTSLPAMVKSEGVTSLPKRLSVTL